MDGSMHCCGHARAAALHCINNDNEDSRLSSEADMSFLACENRSSIFPDQVAMYSQAKAKARTKGLQDQHCPWRMKKTKNGTGNAFLRARASICIYPFLFPRLADGMGTLGASDCAGIIQVAVLNLLPILHTK